MRYQIQANSDMIANIEAALKIVDPAAVFGNQSPNFLVQVNASPSFDIEVDSPQLPTNANHWEYHDREIFDPRYTTEDCHQRLKELVRLGVISLFSPALNSATPWGILSGVRPTKIFHYLRDKQFSIPEIHQRLQGIYGLAPEKIDLLVDVGRGQEKFFSDDPKLISVYLGIPFCPTRCGYCSFAAVSLETHSHLVQPYLKSLAVEIEAVAKLCQEMQLKVETIYMGGGTPTSIDSRAFSNIVKLLSDVLRSKYTKEFTVEAGRPETITLEKLEAMREAKVNRISINPQTMHQRTLDLIGRKHTVANIAEAIRLAAEFPELTINMDLILGLPGETKDDFDQSLTQILTMKPTNITIHTLAPKRAAAWRKKFTAFDFATDSQLAEAARTAQQRLDKSGYHPYYLYRQRMILAQLENIGYAQPGTESIYNIQMMEERQTIIGIGAGAVTKWVKKPEYRVTRLQNPGCPATYSKLINDLIDKKAQQIRLLLG